MNAVPASGAKITLAQGTATPVSLAELAPGTGFYGPSGAIAITPGASYTLQIDGDAALLRAPRLAGVGAVQDGPRAAHGDELRAAIGHYRVPAQAK